MTSEATKAAVWAIPGNWSNWDDRRMEAARAIDRQAQRDGTLEGRIVQFRVADNFGTYIVTEACRRYVILSWVFGYREPTVDSQAGKITREYAERLTTEAVL